MRYAIEAALDAGEITDLALSTDDQDILNIGKSYKSLLCIERPKAISGDLAPAISYVHHALEVIAKQYDLIVIVQPSSPFTTGEDINNTIRLLYDTKADSAVSVMKLDHAIHPVKLKTMDGLELRPFIEKERGRMSEQALPKLYVRNCSVYVSTIEVINKGLIIGDTCLGYVMPREKSIDINDPIDFEFAEFMLERHFVK